MLESQQIPAHKRYFSAYARERGSRVSKSGLCQPGSPLSRGCAEMWSPGWLATGFVQRSRKREKATLERLCVVTIRTYPQAYAHSPEQARRHPRYRHSLSSVIGRSRMRFPVA